MDKRFGNSTIVTDKAAIKETSKLIQRNDDMLVRNFLPQSGCASLPPDKSAKIDNNNKPSCLSQTTW
jgi:hypothetical protein